MYLSFVVLEKALIPLVLEKASIPWVNAKCEDKAKSLKEKHDALMWFGQPYLHL